MQIHHVDLKRHITFLSDLLLMPFLENLTGTYQIFKNNLGHLHESLMKYLKRLDDQSIRNVGNIIAAMKLCVASKIIGAFGFSQLDHPLIPPKWCHICLGMWGSFFYFFFNLCGVPAEIIKAQGNWKSLSYLDLYMQAITSIGLSLYINWWISMSKCLWLK